MVKIVRCFYTGYVILRDSPRINVVLIQCYVVLPRVSAMRYVTIKEPAL